MVTISQPWESQQNDFELIQIGLSKLLFRNLFLCFLRIYLSIDVLTNLTISGRNDIPTWRLEKRAPKQTGFVFYAKCVSYDSAKPCKLACGECLLLQKEWRRRLQQFLSQFLLKSKKSRCDNLVLENKVGILSFSELTETHFSVRFEKALCFLRVSIEHFRCRSAHSRLIDAAGNRVPIYSKKHCFVQYFEVLSEKRNGKSWQKSGLPTSYGASHDLAD